MIPSQKQIDQSKLFLERPSDKTALVANVSDTWMPILEDRLWLAVEAPDRMKHKDETAPLYKFKDLLRLVPSAAGAWTAKNAKPALVAAIPPTTTTPLETAIGVEGLHTMAALCKVTIPKLPRDPGKKAKQYSFCGYCGARIENFETDINHIWHHLCLELLCRGCYVEGLHHECPDDFTPQEVRSHPEHPAATEGQQAKGLPEQEEIAPHLGTPTVLTPAPGSIHLHMLLCLRQPYQGRHSSRRGCAPPIPTTESGPFLKRSIPPLIDRGLFTPEYFY